MLAQRIGTLPAKELDAAPFTSAASRLPADHVARVIGKDRKTIAKARWKLGRLLAKVERAHPGPAGKGVASNGLTQLLERLETTKQTAMLGAAHRHIAAEGIGCGTLYDRCVTLAVECGDARRSRTFSLRSLFFLAFLSGDARSSRTVLSGRSQLVPMIGVEPSRLIVKNDMRRRHCAFLPSRLPLSDASTFPGSSRRCRWWGSLITAIG